MLPRKYSKKELLLRDVLRNARKKRALTQKNLAEKLGLRQSFVSKYESGERVLAFTEVLEICDILQVDIVDLVARVKMTPYEEGEVDHYPARKAAERPDENGEYH